MRRARRLHDLPSSSEDDDDFAEKQTSSSSSSSNQTSNLSSLYEENSSVSGNDDDGNQKDAQQKAAVAPSALLSASNRSVRAATTATATATTHSSNATNNSSDENDNARSTLRRKHVQTTATGGTAATSGNTNATGKAAAATTVRVGRLGVRRAAPPSISESDISYDSEESAVSISRGGKNRKTSRSKKMKKTAKKEKSNNNGSNQRGRRGASSGNNDDYLDGDDDDDDDLEEDSDDGDNDITVSDVLMRGGDITSKRTRDAAAAMAELTRRQLLGEGSTKSRPARNQPSRSLKAKSNKEAKKTTDDDDDNVFRGSEKQKKNGSPQGSEVDGGEGEFVRTDSVVEDFDSEEERQHYTGTNNSADFGGHGGDDDDDDEDESDSSIDYDSEEENESDFDDDDSISDDEADFEPAPPSSYGDDNDDEEEDEDEEEENVLFDLSQRLGGAAGGVGGAYGSQQISSIKPLLRVVRTIIKMEKAMSVKQDLLKALETRQQTETLVVGAAATPTPTALDDANNVAVQTAQQSENTTAPLTADRRSSSRRRRAAAAPTQERSLEDQIVEVKSFLIEIKPLLTDQWGIAARLVHMEFLRSMDAYSHTLDFQDRGSFERITRILLGREELFEIIDGHLLVGDMKEEIPRYAAFIAYLVSEGTREPVFGATAVDLFPIVLSDPSRLKRIVALASLFTLLDKEYEEERTISELLASDVPRAMLMRIREYYPILMQPYRNFTSNHLMHYATTSADEGGEGDMMDEFNAAGSAAATAGLRRGGEEEVGDASFNFQSALARTATGTALITTRGPPQGDDNTHTDSAFPPPPALIGDDSEDDHDDAPPVLNLPLAGATLLERGVHPMMTMSGNASSMSLAELSSLNVGPYVPKIGDIVARGPQWHHGEQDHGCKRGVIVSIVSRGPDEGDEEELSNNGEEDVSSSPSRASSSAPFSGADYDDEPDILTYTVLVRWDPDDDLLSGTTKRRINQNLRGKLFKYRCGGYTHREVVSLAEYRRLNVFDLNSHDFKFDEFFLMAAICGVLSHKKPMVSLIVEHQILEGMISILQSGGLRYGALTQEIVLARITNCNLDSDEDALKFEWHSAHLQPPAVEKAVKAARAWRELTARGLWVLNGCLSHKQLGSMFLRLDGLPHVLALANSYPNVVSHRYGCGLVLSLLAKAQLLSEVVAASNSAVTAGNSDPMNNDEDLLAQMLRTCFRLLESPNADIKQAIATCYYHGLSYVPFVRLFDAGAGIVGIVRELKVALGLQGHTNQLLPADQRPVEMDMLINKNAHLINTYLRVIFVYLGSHLLQLGMVLFRRQRSGGGGVGGATGGGRGHPPPSSSGMERVASFAGGDSQVLPRDDTALEAVIAALHQPDVYANADSTANRHSYVRGEEPLAAPPLTPTVPSTSEGSSTTSVGPSAPSGNSSSAFEDAQLEYVAHSLISAEQWKPFRELADDYRLHEILLLVVHTFETHRKRDVRMAALNVLYSLSVAPCTRTPIAECFVESPDSIDEFRISSAANGNPQKHRGLKVLLQVTEESDLTSKEAVLANIKAMNILALLMLPPLSVVNGYSIASFDRVTGAAGLVVSPAAAIAGASAGVDAAASYATICSLFRACDGVKTLLSLKLPSAETASDLSNLLPLHFYMFAAQVFIFSSLRYFGDTPQLFSVLGVRKLAVDLQVYFRQFRQQTATDAASEPLMIRTFMNNCLVLATGAPVHHNIRIGVDGKPISLAGGLPHTHQLRAGGAGGAGGASAGEGSGTTYYDADGQVRQFVLEHAYLDYNKDSLLELIARHLQAEGLVQAADVLRREADLPDPTPAVQQIASPNAAVTTPSGVGSNDFPRGSSPLLSAHQNNTSNHHQHRAPSCAIATTNGVTPQNGGTTPQAAAAAVGVPPPATNSTTLDGIVRSFLRQTQEACPRPIATLPKIDLLRTQPIVGFDYAAPVSGTAGVGSRIGCNEWSSSSAAMVAMGVQPSSSAFGSGLGAANASYYSSGTFAASMTSSSSPSSFSFGYQQYGGGGGVRTIAPPPTSLANRMFNRRLGLKQWNGCLANHYRQIHKTRFPMYELKNTSNDDFDIAVVDFCDYGESVIAAGTDGTLVIFSHSERGQVKETHFLSDENETMFMDISPDCSLVMVVNRDGVGKVLRREALSNPSPYTFDNASAAMFSPIGNRIAATLESDDVKILDVGTGTSLDILSGMEGARNNHLNVGVFDITGTLVLNHGTLFDLRQANRPVFRFDCVSEHFSGIFHPSSLSVIVDGNVWDLRTMSTVLSCNALLNSLPQYGRFGTHFYAPLINTEASRPLGIVNVVETRTMSLVTTFQLDSHLETFALDTYTEGSFATVNESVDADKILKVYQIGRNGDANSGGASRQLQVPQSMDEPDDEDDLLGDDDDDLLDDDDDEEEDDGMDMDMGDEEDDLYGGSDLDDSFDEEEE